MDKIKLIVVRHGETLSNLTGTVTGRSEDILTANGREQMLKVREKLLKMQQKEFTKLETKKSTAQKTLCLFNAVYASPMKRCIESVQIVAPEYDPIYDDRLAERDLGELTNYNIDELWQKPLWNSLEVERMGSGAETLLSGLNRVRSFLDDLKNQYPDGAKLLLVTHSFISRCLWIITENITNEEEMSNFVHPNDQIKTYEY